MPDYPTQDPREQEFLRHLVLAWRAAIDAGGKFTMDQALDAVRVAADKVGLVPEDNSGAQSPSEVLRVWQRWEEEISQIADALTREDPNTYRDPAFKAAIQARVPELVNRLMKRTQ